MAFDAHTNFAYSTVATAPSPASSGTSLTVAGGTGVLFPTPPPFNAVVWPAGAHPEKANAEIVRVTAIPSTDTLTILREQEGTTARAIEVGDQIRAWITNWTLSNIEEAANNNEAAIATEKARAEAAEKAVEEAAAAKAATAQGAAEAASIAVGQRGASNGVAKLEGGRLPEAELPVSVVTNRPKTAAKAKGVVALDMSKYTFFPFELEGATEFEVTNAPSGLAFMAELLLTPGKYTWSVKSASWVGSEPAFGEGQALITILCVEGKVLLLAGVEGRRGEAGTNGSTVRNGTTAPEESLGANGDFYIKTESGVPVAIYGPKSGGKWPAGVTTLTLKGETGATGAKGETGNGVDPSGSVFPWITGNAKQTTTQVLTANQSRFVLAVIRKAGKKLKIYVSNGATVKGHLKCVVLDTGQASANHYTIIKEGAEVAQAGANEYQLLGELEKTSGEWEVGEVVILGVMADNSESTIGLQPELNGSGLSGMPAGFVAGLGTLTVPRIVGVHTFGSFAFATMTEAQMEAASKIPNIWGRVE
jgi:hypothetical protein